MREDVHLVRIRSLFELAAAFAQLGKDRYVTAEHVLEIDFGHAAGRRCR